MLWEPNTHSIYLKCYGIEPEILDTKLASVRLAGVGCCVDFLGSEWVKGMIAVAHSGCSLTCFGGRVQQL